MARPKTTSPKGFSASKCDVRNWIFSKSWEFLGNSWIFWEFFGKSLGILSLGIKKSADNKNLFEYGRNWFICQDFGVMEKEGRTKGLDHLAHSWGVLAVLWVPNEIDSLNFQHMLLFWFCEASPNLSLFRQLFFPKEKCWKIAISIHWFFSIFPLVPPWELWKKSCLNKLKFGEASRNQKRSICWKFKLSISLGTAKTPPAVGEMI